MAWHGAVAHSPREEKLLNVHGRRNSCTSALRNRRRSWPMAARRPRKNIQLLAAADSLALSAGSDARVCNVKRMARHQRRCTDAALGVIKSSLALHQVVIFC